MNTNNTSVRIINILFVLFLCTSFSSCNNIVDPVDYKLDCDKLKTGIININSEIVKLEVNKLVTDLEPNKTSSDNIGQKENINILINRLNSQCNDINAELKCYACIETNPPQSEILVTIDSVGTQIKRVIDIFTPSDSNLSCSGIHEYYNG